MTPKPYTLLMLQLCGILLRGPSLKVASFLGSGRLVGPFWVVLIGSSLVSLVTPLLP